MGPSQAGQSWPESWRDDVITREGEGREGEPALPGKGQSGNSKENETMQIILRTKQSNGMSYVVGFPILSS